MQRLLTTIVTTLLTSLYLLNTGHAFAVSQTQTADLNSTLAQSAARTTTATEPFKYQLKFPQGITVLYNGCRGSRIEPCGCRALNLGGIDKEAAMVQTIRRHNLNNLFLDAGGYFREFTDPSMRLQTWHMLDALARLNCQVVNIGYPDLRQGLATLKHFESRFKLPFISANIIDSTTGKPVFPAFKTFEIPRPDGTTLKLAVVGVTSLSKDTSHGGTDTNPTQAAQGTVAPRGATQSGNMVLTPIPAARWMIAESNGYLPGLPTSIQHPSPGQGGAAATPAPGGSEPAIEFAVKGAEAFSSPAPPYRVEDPLAAAKAALEELQAQGYTCILLTYSTARVAEEMAAQLPDYDLIIAGDYVDGTAAGSEYPRRNSSDAPMLATCDHDGKYLGIIEMATTSSVTGDLLPVLQTIEPLPEFHKYIDNFTRQTAALPVEQSSGIAEKIYSGATSCRSCHAQAYTQWKTHHHSRAMKALVDKNMHFNPDCLKCHTVAYRMPGGFTDLRVTANLANVQCEVCHGPGEAHVKNMRAAEALKREGKPAPPADDTMRMAWDANFCMQCHDPQNDPHFNFTEDIQRVRHKNPAAPRVRPTTVSLEMM